MAVKKSPAKSPPHVVVIGGGLMGTSSALALARAGAKVTVLEKAVPGAEASSAAAGILGAEIENHENGPMTELCRRSRALYPDWVKALVRATSIDPGFLEGGSLKVALNQDEKKTNRAAHGFQLKDKKAKELSPREVHALEPELTSAPSTLFFERDARITPKLLFRATHLAAQSAGVQFRSGSVVRRIEIETRDGRSIARGVRLEDDSLLGADRVVLAAGSWTSLVAGLPKPHAKVIPARGQLLELSTDRVLLRRLVFGAGVYLIPRADGRILVGSTLEFVGFKKGVTASGLSHLLRGATTLVPALAEAEIEGHWSNFRPYTEDQLPLLGSADVEGLVIAAGHYRNGILLAPVTAEIVTDLCLGRKTKLPLEAFSPLRRSP